MFVKPSKFCIVDILQDGVSAVNNHQPEPDSTTRDVTAFQSDVSQQQLGGCDADDVAQHHHQHQLTTSDVTVDHLTTDCHVTGGSHHFSSADITLQALGSSDVTDDVTQHFAQHHSQHSDVTGLGAADNSGYDKEAEYDVIQLGKSI